MSLSENELWQAKFSVRTIEALAQALDIGIAIFDRDDKLVAASPEVRRFFGLPEDLMQPGTRLRSILGATYDSGVRLSANIDGKPRHMSREDWLAERIAIHWRERYESIDQLPDGRWVCINNRRMAHGVLISTIADVSEQKRRDLELAEARQEAALAHHIFDNLATPVLVKDSAMRYVMVNEAFCRVPGLQARQIIGRTARDLMEPELAEYFEKYERQVLETGIAFEGRDSFVRSDGEMMHVVTRVHRSGEPDNYYLTVSFDDITNAVSVDDAQRLKPRFRVLPHMKSEMLPTQPETPSASKPGRVLVLDVDSQRAADRVAQLTADGTDALAVCDVTQVIAFLETAQSMGVTIDATEVCETIADGLKDNPDLKRFPQLASAVEARTASTAPVPPKLADPETAKASAPLIEPVKPAHQPKANEAAVKEAPKTVAKSQVQILVAEDNAVNQIVFEQILEGADVDFTIVGDGEKAVEAWRDAKPDMILMDVSMPVMNGLQATEAIRKAEDAAGGEMHTPIIAVTAHAMSGDKERCFEAGMDDYLSKPVSPEKLEAMIKKWTGSVGSNRYTV